jgi:hypothetical protein
MAWPAAATLHRINSGVAASKALAAWRKYRWRRRRHHRKAAAQRRIGVKQWLKSRISCKTAWYGIGDNYQYQAKA